MGLGTFTEIKFKGPGIDNIYEYAKEAVETDFFDRVFHNDTDWLTASDEEYEKWGKTYGVTSLCQGRTHVEKNGDEVFLSVYSVYDTPRGVWKKIAEDFPEIIGKGIYYREGSSEFDAGSISIKNGKTRFTKPKDE